MSAIAVKVFVRDPTRKTVFSVIGARGRHVGEAVQEEALRRARADHGHGQADRRMAVQDRAEPGVEIPGRRHAVPPHDSRSGSHEAAPRMLRARLPAEEKAEDSFGRVTRPQMRRAPQMQSTAAPAKRPCAKSASATGASSIG